MEWEGAVSRVIQESEDLPEQKGVAFAEREVASRILRAEKGTSPDREDIDPGIFFGGVTRFRSESCIQLSSQNEFPERKRVHCLPILVRVSKKEAVNDDLSLD